MPYWIYNSLDIEDFAALSQDLVVLLLCIQDDQF